MSKHTPGPWTYFVGNANGRGLVRVETARDAPHAGLFVCSMHRGAEAEANARLIAAAPDMLDTERRLAAEVGGLRAFEHEIRAAIGNTNWSLLMQRLAEADAAIAKAAV